MQSIFNATVNGVYSVRVVYGNCTNESNVIHLTVYPTPKAPTITQTGDTLHSSEPEGNQWFRNGQLIPGATNADIFPISEGYYSVKVKNEWDCESESNLLAVFTDELNDVEYVRLFPNPAHDKVYVESKISLKELRLTNLLGIKLWRWVSSDGTINRVIEIPINNFPNGVFLAQFITDNGYKDMLFSVMH